MDHFKAYRLFCDFWSDRLIYANGITMFKLSKVHLGLDNYIQQTCKVINESIFKEKVSTQLTPCE